MADESPEVVALAGGTGFTGRRVAERLAQRGAKPVCLVRLTSDVRALPPAAECRLGDLSDPTSLVQWLSGCSALIYCASMGFGHVPGVVAACQRVGLRRAVFVSTTALFTRMSAGSKAVRQAAEAAVIGSGLQWTILRPTMIYGARGDRNIERLLQLVSRWRLVPVPGTGGSLVQPVHVDDLADTIVATLSVAASVGNAYELSGKAPLSLDATVDAAAAGCGKRIVKMHLPLSPVAAVLGALERVGVRPRITREQVLRLAEDKAFPHEAARRDLGFVPRGFEEGVEEEARALGLVRA